jgi:hypothetical protein
VVSPPRALLSGSKGHRKSPPSSRLGAEKEGRGQITLTEGVDVSSAPENASRTTILLRLFFVARRCTLARLAFLAFTGFNFLAFARPTAFLATRAFRDRVLANLVAFVALIGLAFRRFAFKRFAFTRLAFSFFAMSHLPS